MLGKLTKVEEKAVKEFKDILLERLGDNIKLIRLFGSKVRGDFHEESDIDILVFVKEGDRRLGNRLADLSFDLLLKYGVLISPIMITQPEYLKHKRWETHFIKNIEREGVDIWKEESLKKE